VADLAADHQAVGSRRHRHADPRLRPAEKSPFRRLGLDYREGMARTRARIDVTVPGLVWAGGVGVFLSGAAMGVAGLIATALHQPHRLLALPGAVLLGALAGVLLAHLTRRTVTPRLAHRSVRFTLAGSIATPLYVMFGQLGSVATAGLQQAAAAIALLSGLAAMVAHVARHTRATRRARAAASATALAPAPVPHG
jgi:hypothetical protein